MNITLICVGRCKEKYWNDAIAEYLKRLSRYAKTEIIEVPDEMTKEEASDRENERVKSLEGQRILQKIPEGAYVIATAIEGTMYDSPGLSDRMSLLMTKGESRFVIIIGGSLGLSSEVLSRADEKWSFSKMTFPHQMMRVILLEQLYRGFRIMHHEPYHK